MKALELLKQHRRYYTQYNPNATLKEQLDEVIKELEDLQSRSCEGCKHFSTGKQPDGFSWYKCEHNFECKRCFPDNFERIEK